MGIYAGDEDNGDDITSGPYVEDLDEDRPCPCGLNHTAAEHSYNPDLDDEYDEDSGWQDVYQQD